METKQIERITVDTTVQPKAVTFPTDAKLRYKAIVSLGTLAKKEEVELRQSYVRVAKDVDKSRPLSSCKANETREKSGEKT